GKAALMVIGVFLSASVLGSCSQVPDAVNPAEWYRGTVDFFAGEDRADKKKQDGKDSGLVADRGKAPPGSDQPFPKLSSVDRQASARDSTSGGLSADHDRPQYAPTIPRQDQSTATGPVRPAPATPTPSVAAAQPAPKPVPVSPVARAPIQKPVARMPVKEPPVMAKPTPAPKFSPPVMTADQKSTERRLARQLAEIRARASALAEVPVTSRMPAARGEQETIVVSSEGIQTLGAMAAETTLPPVPASPPQVGATSKLLDDRITAPVRGTAVKVATILFDNGSSKLKARDKRILDAVVRLQRKKGGRIRIVGHASSRTRNLSPVKHKMANFKVSVDRAYRIAGELIRLGAKKKDIHIAAVSDSEPIYYEFMPSGEAGNRRSEVYLVN
ncbi:MAG: OmpA family protein, partial [Alphaproteobacteria bacterium]